MLPVFDGRFRKLFHLRGSVVEVGCQFNVFLVAEIAVGVCGFGVGILNLLHLLTVLVSLSTEVNDFLASCLDEVAKDGTFGRFGEGFLKVGLQGFDLLF